MKLFVTFLIVFGTIKFTDSAEINLEKEKSNKDCKTVLLEPGYYENNEEDRGIASNEESSCQEKSCGVEKRVLSSSASPQHPELEILENIPVAPNYFYGLSPVQRPFNWNGQWQRIVNLPELRRVPYNGIQYFVHPSQYSAYSPSEMYFPPTVPTYARRSIPELHRQIYSYQRPTRVARSRQEDDFLAELRHMAMMNNILPTMPYLRSSSYDNVPYEASSVGGVTAVFPASPSNCAVPILFSCSPKITRGSLAEPLPSDYNHSQRLDSPKEHLEQSFDKEFVVEDKSDSSQIGSSSESSEIAVGYGNGNTKNGPLMNAIDRALKPKHKYEDNANKKLIVSSFPVANVTS